MDIYRHTCPFLFLLAALATGILCGNDADIFFYIFYLTATVAILCHLLSTTRPISSFFLLLAFFSCGLVLAGNNEFSPDRSKVYSVQGRCEEKLSEDTYIFRAFNQKLYLRCRDTNARYAIGDSLSFPTRFQPLQETANDGEFDYNRYLKQQGMHYQVMPMGAIRQTGHSHTVFSYFQSVRSRLLAKTDVLFTDPEVNAVMKALCLGYKNDLDAATKNRFITSGTIHLLAVSGLHVGAIFLLISAFFRFCNIYNKKYHLLIIPLLWCYVIITGLSPSAVRAATILSFIVIGRAFARDYSPVNSIAASAFFTLVLSPLTLYTVSFQMSYAAYTGIILLYPILNRPAHRFHPAIARIYSLFCLTIAAQAAVLPLSGFYFHNISVNSFAINLLAVPIATFLLYGGIVLLALPASIGIHLAFITRWAGELLLYLLGKFNAVAWNIGELYPGLFQILLIYLCLVALYLYLQSRKYRQFRGLWICLATLLGYTCFYNHTLSRQQEIVIFNIPRGSCILLNRNGHYTYLRNTIDSITGQKKVKPYIYRNKLRPTDVSSGFLTANILYHNHRLDNKQQIIGITGKPHSGAPSQILIVTGNRQPDICFPEGTEELPSQVIADSSNDRETIRAWEVFCRKKQLILLKTTEKGTIRLPLE